MDIVGRMEEVRGSPAKTATMDRAGFIAAVIGEIETQRAQVSRMSHTPADPLRALTALRRRLPEVRASVASNGCSMLISIVVVAAARGGCPVPDHEDEGARKCCCSDTAH